MITLKENLIVVVIAVFIFSGLFYLSIKNNSVTTMIQNTISDKLSVKWQTVSIEETEDVYIDVKYPIIVIAENKNKASQINKYVINHIESLKEDFISAVNTIAEDGKASKLNINTEILFMNSRLLSLVFTSSEHISGSVDNDSEQTFLVFDLTNNRNLIGENELFCDDLAWHNATELIKKSLLSEYQEKPNCDLLLAPKNDGLVASCIGVDWNREGKHFSIKKDIHISLIKDFLSPLILLNITQS